MTVQTSETPILDLIEAMTVESAARSSLDPATLTLVRLSALVAADAPVVSYALNLDSAANAGLSPERVRAVLTAIAPIVGTGRVSSAMWRIARALAIPTDVAEPDANASGGNGRTR